MGTREEGAGLDMGAPALDAVLDGCLPPGSSRELVELAHVTSALTAGTEPSLIGELRDLPGEAAAMRAFRAASAADQRQRDQVPSLRQVRGRRLGVVAGTAVVVMAFGAGAAAAGTGQLPSGLQDLAHRAFGAPTSEQTVTTATQKPEPRSGPAAPAAPAVSASSQPGASVSSPKPSPVPPESSSVVFGLCRAVDRSESGKILNSHSAAARKLLSAAAEQGESVAVFCQGVPAPPRAVGPPAPESGADAPGRSGNAGESSGSAPSAKNGKPDAPSGKPTDVADPKIKTNGKGKATAAAAASANKPDRP